MGKEANKTKIRNAVLEKVAKFIEEEFDTYAKPVGSGEYTFLVPDEEGNKIYANVKISIPRGTRDGMGGYNPYDGYEAAKEYAQERKDKETEKAGAEAKKQAKIAADEKKREEKKALAEANKNLHELRKISITPKAE